MNFIAITSLIINISDYAILYLQPLWLVGTSVKNSQIPFMGDLAKTNALQWLFDLDPDAWREPSIYSF